MAHQAAPRRAPEVRQIIAPGVSPGKRDISSLPHCRRPERSATRAATKTLHSLKRSALAARSRGLPGTRRHSGCWGEGRPSADRNGDSRSRFGMSGSHVPLLRVRPVCPRRFLMRFQGFPLFNAMGSQLLPVAVFLVPFPSILVSI